jgi:hypothetical protein
MILYAFYTIMHMQKAPRHMVFLCIKIVPVLFLLDLARVLFRPVPFEINRAIMRLACGGRVSSKKNGERERDKRTRGQRTPDSELAYGRLWLIIDIELTIKQRLPI